MALSAAAKDAQAGILASGGKVGKMVNLNREIRINDGSNMFEEGDEFVIETDWRERVFERNFRGNPAVGMLVNVNGVEKEFYFSSFTKSVMPYDDNSQRVKLPDGKNAPNVSASGTAVAIFVAPKILEKGMDALVGKTVVLSKIDEVQTLRQREGGQRTLGNQWVFTIDIKK